MAEEIKVNGGQNGSSGLDNNEPRSEKRFKDLTDKLSEQERINSLKIEEEKTAREKTEKELKEARFELDLTKESSKYPFANDFKDEIKSYAEKNNLSVSEATTLVLAKNGKLNTNQDITRNNATPNSFGGSAPTMKISGEQDPNKMTQEERRAKLIEMEQNGNFGIKDGGLYIN